MSARFTIDGSQKLEQHLAQVCEDVRSKVRSIVPAGRLEGLVLGGGYGRGEGGVLRDPGGDLPYNDLEFFVFISGNTHINEKHYRKDFLQAAESLTAVAGIDVEFKIVSLAKLRASTPSMFYYDLMMGHRWLSGDDSLFAGCDHHRDPRLIPLHEATRLLFNRCSGLFYAKARLQQSSFNDADADFIGRNIAKAKLALGDAWLTVNGLYDWSCNERHRRLMTLKDEWAPQLSPHHAEGVEFKLHPHRDTASAKARLQADHQQISKLARDLWLHLEGHRVHQSFPSPRAYAFSRSSLCPETSSLKNALCNLRSFGLRGLTSRFFSRYPRERLLRALPLLLWDDGSTKADSALISECLFCRDTELNSAASAYEALWHQYN